MQDVRGFWRENRRGRSGPQRKTVCSFLRYSVSSAVKNGWITDVLFSSSAHRSQQQAL